MLALVVHPLGAQTNSPEKPVRLVVGFTAGSATDVTGRMFAQRFSEAWGQPVIVENIAGNSGAIGTDKVAKAAPDGYTLMWSGNAAITILPSLQTLPFDPLKDLAPITTTLSMPSIFFVNNDLPVKSIADLIAYAKANPGKLSYGTPGVGTPQHVAGELFCHLAGIKMEHIPYRGANLADVMGGIVPVGIQNAGASLPLVRDGRVRGIGITSLKRSPNAPDLPTLVEAGFPGFEATSWFALIGPAGTPQPSSTRCAPKRSRCWPIPTCRRSSRHSASTSSAARPSRRAPPSPTTSPNGRRSSRTPTSSRATEAWSSSRA